MAEALEQVHTKTGGVLLQNVARPLGRTGTPDALEQAHTNNGTVLLQNVARPLLGKTRARQAPFFDPKESGGPRQGTRPN